MHRTQAEHVYLDMTANPPNFCRSASRASTRPASARLTRHGHGARLPSCSHTDGWSQTDLWGRSSLPGLWPQEKPPTRASAAQIVSPVALSGLVFGARSGQPDCRPPLGRRSKDSLALRHGRLRHLSESGPPSGKASSLPGSPAPKPDSHTPEAIAARATASVRACRDRSLRKLAAAHHSRASASAATTEHATNNSSSKSSNSAQQTSPNPATPPR
jgi:hypothetical protein